MHTELNHEKILRVAKHLVSEKNQKTPGFLAKVREAAIEETHDVFVVGENSLTSIFHEFSPFLLFKTVKRSEPSLAALTRNFAWATARWVKKGMPVVTKEVYQIRAQICDACPHWDGKARGGLGKCNAPGCGCTSFKRWLATEKCPLGKWPAVS